MCDSINIPKKMNKKAKTSVVPGSSKSIKEVISQAVSKLRKKHIKSFCSGLVVFALLVLRSPSQLTLVISSMEYRYMQVEEALAASVRLRNQHASENQHLVRVRGNVCICPGEMHVSGHDKSLTIYLLWANLSL